MPGTIRYNDVAIPGQSRFSVLHDKDAPMPRTHDFVLADVFGDCSFGGNPLAVFPRVCELAAETMQAIARVLNLSGTTFVVLPAGAGVACTVCVLTPGTELPFAGHRVRA